MKSKTVLTFAAVFLFLLFYLLFYGLEQKEWNNGICKCGGRYELKDIECYNKKTIYFYICGNCQNIVTFYSKMNHYEVRDEEKLAEEIICSKCSDDINRSYTNCSACSRCDNFINGFKKGREESLEEIKQIESVSDFRWEENQRLKKENEEMKWRCKE